MIYLIMINNNTPVYLLSIHNLYEDVSLLDLRTL